MSEYQFVEKPLLTQLDSMGWHIIDQGEGVPKNPAASLRNSFREVVLKEIFSKSVWGAIQCCRGLHCSVVFSCVKWHQF